MKRDITIDIEKLIDETSLLHVLTAIELVCHEKAEHIRVNWQDRATAYPWNLAGNVIGRCLRNRAIGKVS